MTNLTITLGKNVIEVANLKGARAALIDYRDNDPAFGHRGSRDFKKNDGVVKDGKKKVANVSYNGRVWDMEGNEIAL
jgi:hypothetical protein